MIENSISRFKEMELHDVPIESFTINFQSGSILISIMEYDNEVKDYKQISLSFTGIRNIVVENISDLEISEITSCTIEALEVDNSYNVIFDLLYDTPSIPLKIAFNFKTVSVTPPDPVRVPTNRNGSTAGS